MRGDKTIISQKCNKFPHTREWIAAENRTRVAERRDNIRMLLATANPKWNDAALGLG